MIESVPLENDERENCTAPHRRWGEGEKKDRFGTPGWEQLFPLPKLLLAPSIIVI